MGDKLFVNDICEQSIIKISEGDISALSVIYDCVGRLIFTVAFSILDDYQLSQDIMQDTFIQIADKAHTYQKGTNARAWIVSISRNLALNALKSKKREVQTDINPNNAYSVLSEDKLIASIAVSDALTCLTTQEKELVVYKTMSNLLHKQIAQIMGITTANSRQKYKRAIEKLRNFYLSEGGVTNVQKK